MNNMEQIVRHSYVEQVWLTIVFKCGIGLVAISECLAQNPNLPGLMTDKLPAPDDTTTSETFARHLNTLHATRKAFIDTEANERIRRALRTKVRAAEQRYLNSDLVFYKRECREKWLGPGKVVFQDGKVIFLRHGSVFVRVSPNRLCKQSILLNMTRMTMPMKLLVMKMMLLK